MTLTRRNDIKLWEIEGEGVMYDPSSGMGHVLNPTALRIWTLCDGDHTPVDIEKQLAEDFPSAEVAIHEDVSQTIQQFVDLGLVEAA